MTINFTVDITPMPWQRPRFNKNGSVFESKALKEYKQKIADAARKAMGDHTPFDCPVSLAIAFFKKNRIFSRNFGDVDNLIKAVLDAFNGIVYSDDKLVYSLTAAKHQDKAERIWISINTFTD